MTTHPPEPLTLDDKDVRKLRKREAKLLEDSRRRPDAWERYHVLVDVVDTSRRLIELGDHKARFALVIVGFLNAAMVFVGTRSEVLDSIPEPLRPWLAAFLLPYTAVVLGFFLYAIESLRPRPRAFLHELLRQTGGAAGAPGQEPLGLLFWADTAEMGLPELRRAWDEVRLGQINEELVLLAHSTAQINKAKFAALHGLYLCLRIMTVLAAMLIGIVGYHVLLGNGAEPVVSGDPKPHVVERAAVLPPPERLRETGSREPSGIAFHAGLGALFLVGDEGRLVRLDLAGRPLGSDRVRGDIEDLAVHAPSGLLLLLSERPPELISYDPAGRREVGRFPIDTTAVLGERQGAPNQGFEGIAFREDASRPGGGLVYLVHQRAPGMIVSLAFDPARASGPVGAASVVARWPLPGRRDFRAVAYVPSLDRLLVIAGRDRLLVIDPSGAVESELALPARRPEGLCFDAAGTLWVADEALGLLRFGGALRALEAHLSSRG